MQQKEKVRVYALARELNVESKDLLDMCRQAGYDVKNQLSSLEPEQRTAIEQLVKRGGKGGVAVAAPPPVTTLPTDLGNKVRVLAPARKREAMPPPPPPAPPQAPAPTLPPAPAPVVTGPPPPALAPVVTGPPPPALAPVVTPVSLPVPPVAPTPPQPIPVTERKPTVAPAALSPAPKPQPHPAEPVKPIEPPRSSEPPPPPRPVEAPAAVRSPDVPAKIPDLGGKVPSLGGPKPPPPRPSGGPASPRPGGPRTIRPQRSQRPLMAHAHLAPVPVPRKPLLKKEPEKKQEPVAQKPIAYIKEAVHPGALTAQEVTKIVAKPPVPESGEIEDEEGGDGKGKGGKRPGVIPGRDVRHAKRAERQKARRTVVGEVHGTRVLLPEEEERHRRSPKHKKIPKLRRGTQPRIDRVQLTLPITVRALSEAIGMKVGDLLFRLRDQGAAATITINSIVEPVMAELIAHDAGHEIEIKKPLDVEEQLFADLEKKDDSEDLVPRAPIVTIMGHVDHGKTTLLDKIRASNVAATEAGGITQVIRAWRVEHNGKPVTFLDTPGHEAFTKMRARGANVTDIAVIVVAADDGVMPQTEEAISHAKAAGVSLVVAINKVDLPNANLTKTRQQLYSLSVLPDNMGGDTPFVETSAATGKGIDELLEQLSVVAELKELKANPKKAARGTCLEAMLSEGEGVRATLLVRDGTLRRGDVILCGATYGRVRAMYDDRERPIQEAGPSVPVRITGLDAVPNADDPFQAVPDLSVAREIAEKRKGQQQQAAQAPRVAVTLENLSEAKIAELKVILKADFRGSIEAIRKELEKLTHAEVRVKILHTAIGGITESDVALALTSPEDTIVVGFNVVPDDAARALAEQRGVQIRQYDIIYNLTDDIRSALEGKLKPHEQIIHLGRAVVRETFKISRVGTVAGCYVTQGVIERSAKVRLIRNGVVIYPPVDRTASLESLKRFKEDSREVREGFECGMKIAGYDDLKVDDVIEAYRVEQVQRTL